MCRHISATDGDTQIQFVLSFRSEICVRANSPCSTWARHWSLRRKIWISHWPIQNVLPPSHSQSICGRVGSTKWCAVIGLCDKQPKYATTYYMHGSNSGSCISCVRMLRCISEGHIELGTVWAMNPRPCSLARWTRILRIRQHIVWD